MNTLNKYTIEATVKDGCLENLSIINNEEPEFEYIDYSVTIFDDSSNFMEFKSENDDQEIDIAVLILDGVFDDFKAFINKKQQNKLFSIEIIDLD